MFELDIDRCIGTGLPHNMEMNAWSEIELKFEAMYDSTLNRVFRMREVEIV